MFLLPLPRRLRRLLAGRGPQWALAIHGGAGTIPKNLPEERKQQYLKSLTRALEIGREVLKGGGTSLDAVEKVVRFLEDDPLFNAGKGAVYTHEGTHESMPPSWTAAICRAARWRALKTVKHPITLARLVKEKSPHVFMVGEGAEAFAAKMKVERVKNGWFDTPFRYQQLQERGSWSRGRRTRIRWVPWRSTPTATLPPPLRPAG